MRAMMVTVVAFWRIVVMIVSGVLMLDVMLSRGRNQSGRGKSAEAKKRKEKKRKEISNTRTCVRNGDKEKDREKGEIEDGNHNDEIPDWGRNGG